MQPCHNPSHSLTLVSPKASAASRAAGSLPTHNHPARFGRAKMDLARLLPPTCTEHPSSTKETWAPSAPKRLTSPWYKRFWLGVLPSKVSLHKSFIKATHRSTPQPGRLLQALEVRCINQIIYQKHKSTQGSQGCTQYGAWQDRLGYPAICWEQAAGCISATRLSPHTQLPTYKIQGHPKPPWRMHKSFCGTTQVTCEICAIVYTLKTCLFARISSGVCNIFYNTMIIPSNTINTILSVTLLPA